MSRNYLALGAISAGLGVVLGAFAAHALKTRIEPQALAIFEVAVRYQMYHALALVAIGMLPVGIDMLPVGIGMLPGGVDMLPVGTDQQAFAAS